MDTASNQFNNNDSKGQASGQSGLININIPSWKSDTIKIT